MCSNEDKEKGLLDRIVKMPLQSNMLTVELQNLHKVTMPKFRKNLDFEVKINKPPLNNRQTLISALPLPIASTEPIQNQASAAH